MGAVVLPPRKPSLLRMSSADKISRKATLGYTCYVCGCVCLSFYINLCMIGNVSSILETGSFHRCSSSVLLAVAVVQTLEELPEGKIKHRVWSNAQIHRDESFVVTMDTFRSVDLQEAIEDVGVQ